MVSFSYLWLISVLFVGVAQSSPSGLCAGMKCKRPYSVCKIVNTKPRCVCDSCLSDVKDPVCASNKQSYSSICKMREVSCNTNQTLTVKSKGKCPCDAIVDLGFLVKSSGSITHSNFIQQQKIVNDIIGKFKVGPQKTHVSIYSNSATLHFKFNDLQGNNITADNYAKLVNQIRWRCTGYVYINAALLFTAMDMYTLEAGMRKDAEKVLIVLTDGKQITKKGSSTPLSVASSYVKNKNVRVYAIGVGPGVSRKELNEIASDPVRNVFTYASFKTLGSKVQDIVDRICYPGTITGKI